MSEARYPGTWWEATDENGAVDVRVGGVLTIDDAGRAYLEVMSALVDRRTPGATIRRSARSFNKPRLIHGASGGRQLTLLGCTRANGGQTNVGQVTTETQMFRAEAVVVGCWLHNAEDAIFSGMRVEISHLTEWAGRSGLSWDLVTSHPDDHPLGARNDTVHTVELRTVPTVEVDLAEEGIKVALLSAQSLGPGGKENAWGRTHQVRERTLYEVRTPELRHAFDFQQAIRPMQNLLTLATQSGCAVGSRNLISAADTEAGARPAELYFHGEDIAIKASLVPHQLLFTLDDLGGAAALKEWYALSRRIGRPLNTLFGLDYETGGYHETRLFTIATVVEGFHSALCPTSRAITRPEHKMVRQVVDDALADAEKHVRDWASNAVGYNRSGLTQRCTELAALADPTAVEMLLGDVDVWAQWLVHARNTVAHGKQNDPRHNRAPEEGYGRLGNITKHLLHLILMSQLGLDSTQQQRAVADTWGYEARRFRELIAPDNT
ncbi:HEPN domain-containing protein (plasmid) [Gordonia hongkongensis]|uniref:ApeA N-terminal domain 1-containing protein n=1 Tax=Gordonia hongkongensis TaxID=1701090 RepID=UPI0030CC889B